MARKYYKIKKVKYPIFVLTLFLGLGLIGISILQPEVIFGDPGEQIIGEFLFGSLQEFTGQLSTLEFAQFDVDPTTGQIIGSIILGKPDRQGIIQSAADDCNTFGSISQGTQLPMSFGITRTPTICYYGFAEWDISAIPDSFRYTRADITMKPQKFFPNISVGSNVACRLGLLFQPIDTIPTGSLIGKMSGTGQSDAIRTPANTHASIVDGSWCSTGQAATFTSRPNLDGRGRDISPVSAEITRSITGDNRITLFVRFNQNTFPNSGCCWEQDQNFWATTGAIRLSGISPPIVCGAGSQLVGFSCQPLECTGGFVIGGPGGNECIPLICPLGQTVNVELNSCEIITCSVGQILDGNNCIDILCPIGNQLIGSICTPIQCSVGQELIGNTCSQINCAIGTQLIGSTCQPIQCALGTMLVGNNCNVIQCATGQILNGNTCQDILCPQGTILQGNECNVIQCNIGSELVGDSCQNITCPLGTNLVGNNCNPISCQTGTFLSANECLQITCESGQILNGNVCQPVQCQVGEILVDNTCQQLTCPTGSQLIGSECQGISCLATERLQGNTCVKIPLNCPEGSEEFNNVCVQQVATLESPPPTLQFFSSTTGLIDPFVFLIAGVVIAGMSGAGIVIRRI